MHTILCLLLHNAKWNYLQTPSWYMLCERTVVDVACQNSTVLRIKFIKPKLCYNLIIVLPLLHVWIFLWPCCVPGCSEHLTNCKIGHSSVAWLREGRPLAEHIPYSRVVNVWLGGTVLQWYFSIYTLAWISDMSRLDYLCSVISCFGCFSVRGKPKD